MAKTTLDTNIIVSAFTEEEICVKILDNFLSKDRLDSGDSFLTPAVLHELDILFARFQEVLHQIKTIMERKGESLSDSYDHLEEFVDGSQNGSLANGFSNLVQFIKKCDNRGLSIELIRTMITQKLARLHRSDINVAPSFDTVRDREKEINELIETIMNKKINKEGDATILAQLILFNRLTSNDIQLYTRNTADFDSSSDAWKEICSFISVINPFKDSNFI